MPERSPALATPRSVRILEIFFDRYGCLASIERSGRIYERLGIRYVYIVVARLFGEPVLPASRSLREAAALPTPDLTRDQVRELRDRTLYYEVSNLFIFLCYVPLVVMLWMLRARLIVYAAALCSLHGLLVLTERYKRALYSICLGHPDFAATSAGVAAKPRPDGVQATAAAKGIAAWYFQPHRFETERFYRALGMETVRSWVITFTRLTALPQEQRHRNPRSISGSAIENLVAFDEETRASEVSHLIALLLQLPFLVLFLVCRAPFGIAYMLLLLFLNLSFMLLQRATRVRLWRVLAKRRVSRQ